ncbi:hypothetical protein MRX96_031225 [Rhipicephalus microplus]
MRRDRSITAMRTHNSASRWIEILIPPQLRAPSLPRNTYGAAYVTVSLRPKATRDPDREITHSSNRAMRHTPHGLALVNLLCSSANPIQFHSPLLAVCTGSTPAELI